jgi:protein ImuB
MAIPSYDDLTPSIPDVSPGEVFTSVAAVLPKDRHSGPTLGNPSPQPRVPSPESAELFAALHDADDAGIERLMTIARDFSPRIERRRGGTVVLDVSGLQRLFGDPRSIAEHLARAGAPQIAIAVSQTAAILLARTGRGVIVAAGDPGEALHSVPLDILQEFAAEIDADVEATAGRSRPARRRSVRAPRTFEVLQRWGLTTIGEFAALPAADLSARLGPAGIAHQRLARGLDPRPLIPDPGVRRFVESFELEWPIELLEPLSFVFARLLEPLAAALETADRGGVALRLQLRLTDRTIYARTLGLPAPMRDPRVLRTLLLLDLESHPPPAAVDVVTIEIDPAPGRIVQYSLLERPVPSPETLATLMARLGALVGESRCGSPEILDTYRPDGWTMKPVSFTERVVNGPAFAPPDAPARGSADLRASRPDQPTSRPALRRFRPPVAVRVAVEKGRPTRVAIDRRGMPGGVVRQAAGPWRSSGNWWDGQCWNRDEWDVAFEDGAVCRIFQERERTGWFLDGVYD